jgi:hypothetical protein
MLVAAGSVAGIGRLQDVRQEPSPDALQKTVARQNDLICSPPPMNAESMPTAQINKADIALAARVPSCPGPSGLLAAKPPGQCVGGWITRPGGVYADAKSRERRRRMDLPRFQLKHD